MRILVTGGAGYVGSHVVRSLVERGDEVVVVDTLEHGHRRAVAPAARLVVGDIRDVPLVEGLLRAARIDGVVHMAARKSVGESIADPGGYFEANVGGTLALLRAMVAARVGRIVFSSTCAVYGTPSTLPVTETADLRPENPYGESKLLVERLLPWFRDEGGGIESVVLRYFNAAGAWQDGSIGEHPAGADNLVPIALAAALDPGRTVRIHGTDYPTPDGTAVRDYVHVVDLADAHVRALDHLGGGGPSLTLNLGTGRGASVREVLDMVARASGRPVRAVEGPRRPGDPAAIWADSGRAASELGWRAQSGLEEIVTSAWRWAEAHPNGYASD